MSMFKEVPQISQEKFVEYFNSTWTEKIKLEEMGIRENTFTFNINKSLAMVLSIEAPIPWDGLEGPCKTSILWPSATEDVKSHQHHLIVSVSDADLNPVQLSILLTKVTATILATCKNAIGVSWCNATMVIPRDIFIEFSEKVLPEGPPVHIWVDFRVGRGESNNSTGFTTGLAALGLMEIEAIDTPEPVSELKDRLTSLADYLITNGPVIDDGDTVGEDESELIKVVYGNSEFNHEDQVMTLKYEQTKLKKSRLRFW